MLLAMNDMGDFLYTIGIKIHKQRFMGQLDSQFVEVCKNLVACIIESSIDSMKAEKGQGFPMKLVNLMCKLIRLCWVTDNKEYAQRVLDRVLCLGVDYREHFTNCLARVLQELPALVAELRVDIGTRAFSGFVIAMFRRYISEVLGPRPPLPSPRPDEVGAINLRIVPHTD